MSNRKERSHDRKPFDSRRAKAAVTLVTPRNPAPVPPSSAPTEKDEAGRSPQSSWDDV